MNEAGAPSVDVHLLVKKIPVLGVCYGAQLTAKEYGGRVDKSNKREYGRAKLQKEKEDILLKDVAENSQVWMSHSDTITQLPDGFELLATTDSIPVAAFKKSDNGTHSLYGISCCVALLYSRTLFHFYCGVRSNVLVVLYFDTFHCCAA